MEINTIVLWNAKRKTQDGPVVLLVMDMVDLSTHANQMGRQPGAGVQQSRILGLSLGLWLTNVQPPGASFPPSVKQWTWSHWFRYGLALTLHESGLFWQELIRWREIQDSCWNRHFPVTHIHSVLWRNISYVINICFCLDSSWNAFGYFVLRLFQLQGHRRSGFLESTLNRWLREIDFQNIFFRWI